MVQFLRGQWKDLREVLDHYSIMYMEGLLVVPVVMAALFYPLEVLMGVGRRAAHRPGGLRDVRVGPLPPASSSQTRLVVPLSALIAAASRTSITASTARVRHVDVRVPSARRGRGGALFGAMAGKDVGHPVIAFVARHLVERGVRAIHRQLHRPRFREHGRILNRRLVGDGVGIGAREALDDAQVLVTEPVEIADAEAALVVELQVAGFDDERAAFPAAARIAGPLLHAAPAACGRPSSGTMRVSWFISTRMTT